MIIVIGGGPAGFFGAIAAREADPSTPVVLLEKSSAVLAKVKVSGGGRCNVTHACFTPRDLVAYYPRGERELIGPFSKWGPAETVAWFAERGVELKTEGDGRMFPVTDSSGTIVNCLMGAARSVGVEVRTNCPVEAVIPAASGTGFLVRLAGGESLTCEKLLLATGGRTSMKSAPGGTSTAEATPSLSRFLRCSPSGSTIPYWKDWPAFRSHRRRSTSPTSPTEARPCGKPARSW